MNAPFVLPPLDGFNRAELEELIHVLHGALGRADADYKALEATANRAIAMLKAIVEPTIADDHDEVTDG